MARIWIVEDDSNIGSLIEMVLRKDGHDVMRAMDDVELEHMLKTEKRLPDLLLLDLMLRAKNGYQILTEWKGDPRKKSVPIIIVSARAAEGDKVRGLEEGAEDYITKPFGVRELQARVRAALRRIPEEKERLCVGDIILIPQKRETWLSGAQIALTLREFELLVYLVRHANETVSRGELLREVWGYAMEDDSTRTVDVHIKSLRLKLGDTGGETGLIRTVRGTGYRLVAEARG